jgi:hypothetical protein
MHVSVTGVSMVVFCGVSAVVILCVLKFVKIPPAERLDDSDLPVEFTPHHSDQFSDPIEDEPRKQRPPELGIQLAESIRRYRMEHDEIR